jgi:hypothetical protein
MFLVSVRRGAQGHREFSRDVGPVEVGGEEPEHVQFAFAQRLDEPLGGSAERRRTSAGVQEATDVATAVRCFVILPLRYDRPRVNPHAVP